MISAQSSPIPNVGGNSRMSANNILADLPGEGSVLNDRTDFNN